MIDYKQNLWVALARSHFRPH